MAGSGAASGLPWYAIICLPLLFACGMSLFDTLDGTFMNFAYHWAFSNPVRKVYYNLLVLPCGFPPDRTEREFHLLTGRPGWDELPAVRNGRVWILDGPSYFNRPGPRVVRGVEVLAQLLHGVRTGPRPARPARPASACRLRGLGAGATGPPLPRQAATTTSCAVATLVTAP